MKLPNLLATKRGRLTAFFALYMTEGIPLGFTATAIATQMRREGVGPAEIGLFVASLYAPWGWKWIAGPFVDVFSSDRFGRRRTWIIATQLLMVAALLAAMPINFSTELKLFTIVIFIHNCFCATQDVAIDALACNTLTVQERGLANGLMFAGASVGQAIGGAGVLKLMAHTGWTGAYLFVSAVLLSVTIFIALPMREAKGPSRPPVIGSRLAAAGRELEKFGIDAFRAFTGTRGAFVGLVFALLPAGAYGLGLALQSNLAVEMGMSDSRIGDLALVTNIVGAGGCIAGGWMSDKLGRRRMLAVFVASMSLPTLYLAWLMFDHQWIMPVNPTMPDRPVPAAMLLSAFWVTSIVYAFFNGLMYGTRSAMFMDITTPAVAATQFTAYMACLNFVISYSATWQGLAIERFGYPITLLIDGIAGVLPLCLLPLIAVKPSERNQSEAPAVA